MEWIKSGIENPSKSEVIGRCGEDEKNEWLRRTDKSRTLKKIKKIRKELIKIHGKLPTLLTEADVLCV